MDINQIVKEVQAINPAAIEESVLQSLVDIGLEVSDISKSEIPSIAKRTMSGLAIDSTSQATEIKKSSAQITPTSQPLATQPIATNSSVKGGKLAPKKEGAIATKKRGSSKVAKTQSVEKVQIEKQSLKADIQSNEVAIVEEAANAGYNSDVGTLAASAYLGGMQMRFADEVRANMPKAMNGMFDGIGDISSDRHQGIFDHVRVNEPSQKEVTTIDWSF